jgi:hypothetical protein
MKQFMILIGLFQVISAVQQLRSKTPPVTPFLNVLTHAPKMRTLDTLTSTAGWAFYSAFPACCQGSPNYDPNADTTECVQYNRCPHAGVFAGLGNRDLAFVNSNNLISFYDNSDPNNEEWYRRYADKYATVTGTCNGTSHTFQALIADTCGNSDCDNCCQKNADPNTGYLINVEHNTLMRIFGDESCASDQSLLSFSVDMSQPLAVENCGGSIGSCNWPQLCCGADNFCDYDIDACGAGCKPDFGYCAGNNGTCGAIANKTCPDGECCGKDGYCGTGDDYCGDGCQETYGSACTTSSNGNARAVSFFPLHAGIFFVLLTMFLL